MDLLSFLLEDHRCPHCRTSLRLRYVKTVDIAGARDSDPVSSHEVCPRCGAAILLREHAAVMNDWLWGKRLAPGLAVWVLALFTGLPPLLTITGTALLAIGLLLVLHYMVTERLGRRRFREFKLPDRED
ncbi:MAG: hypothetical protein IPH39_20850 [Sulfuritalea sp.]|nr:hypothetical protein [Sulfuritalea sp.]